jgi:diguanylate cyclase (GGDEF)-like protein
MSTETVVASLDLPAFAGSKMHQWAISRANISLWTYELHNDCWSTSHQGKALFGFDADSGLGREAFLSRLSSIERLRVETAWCRLMDDGLAYDIEYVIELDGCERWLWERAEIECAPDGEPYRVLGMVQDVTSRRANEQEIRFRANYDRLTGLSNRHMLDEYLEKSVAMASRRNERMALMAIDLDRFKQVNDTHGHAIGDLVLQAAAKRMQACLRASDMLARQGGDEFIAVLPGVDYDATVGVIALRLIEEVSRPYQICDLEITIGASVGIALLPDDGSRIDEVLGCADSALYKAKHHGRETLYFFQHESEFDR